MNPLKLLWSFYGRIGRLAYLGGLFLNLAWIAAALAALTYLDRGRIPGGPIHPAVFPSLISGFALFTWSKFALAAKRLHDLGMSGWIALVMIIPAFGLIAVIILLVARGDDHDNRYGRARSSGLPSSATSPAV
jgi:uncharacterized membrane protein YhaH (DUF805 family)